jgi:hypothetical protein
VTWFWLLLPVIALCLHVALVRYRLRDAVGDWSALLLGSGRQRVKDLKDELELSALMAGDTFEAARRARSRAEHAEAARLLALAFDVVDDVLPDRLARLRAMSKLSRMVMAVVPLDPLVPRDFTLPHLVRLATLGHLVHHLLASTEERFRWLCLVLGWCYRSATRDLRAARDLAQQRDDRPRAWDRFELGLRDLKALDRTHLEAFRAIVASLAIVGEPSPERVGF